MGSIHILIPFKFQSIPYCTRSYSLLHPNLNNQTTSKHNPEISASTLREMWRSAQNNVNSFGMIINYPRPQKLEPSSKGNGPTHPSFRGTETRDTGGQDPKAQTAAGIKASTLTNWRSAAPPCIWRSFARVRGEYNRNCTSNQDSGDIRMITGHNL